MTRLHVLVGIMLVTAAPAVASGGGGGGGDAFSRPSESAPQYDIATEYRKGMDALQAQRFKEARRAFEHVLSVAPRDANARYLAGIAAFGAGDRKAARRHLERAVKLDGNLIAAHQQLGIVAAQTGDMAKAEAELDLLKARAAACGDTCPDAAALRAATSAVAAAMGSGPRASADLVPGPLFADQAAGDHTYLLAVGLINEQRYEDAIVALRTALKSTGPHPDVLTYLGFAHRKLGRYAAAESYYRQALALAPRHRGATEYYGELKVERGDLSGARAMLASLDAQCAFGCAEAEELRRWIAQAAPPAS